MYNIPLPTGTMKELLQAMHIRQREGESLTAASSGSIRRSLLTIDCFVRPYYKKVLFCNDPLLSCSLPLPDFASGVMMYLHVPLAEHASNAAKLLREIFGNETLWLASWIWLLDFINSFSRREPYKHSLVLEFTKGTKTLRPRSHLPHPRSTSRPD
jgi:hypothetical protein